MGEEMEQGDEGGGGGVSLRDGVNERWQAAAEALGRVRSGLGASDRDADPTSVAPLPPPPPELPLTLSDAQAIVQARIEAEEKRQAKKAMGRAHGRDKENANNAEGRAARALQAAARRKLPWEKKEKNVFWLYVEVRTNCRRHQ